MTTFKEFRFPVAVDWLGERRTRALVDGKRAVELATPPQFRGTTPTLWSPEDALVAAAASCFAVTLAAVCERRGVTLLDLAVDGVGIVGGRPDGGLGFTSVELRARVETAPGEEAAMLAAAGRAEAGCLVSQALAVPVRLELDVRVRRPAAA